VFVPPLYLVGAIRLARPGSPWARWRYRDRPAKLAKAERRERHLRQPVIRAKIWVQDKLTGPHDQPAGPAVGERNELSDQPTQIDRSTR
jgi:hypothetical protein